MVDICLCASTECPRYNDCYRGSGVDRKGRIYTSSYLAEVCNKDNNYSAFIKYKDGDK